MTEIRASAECPPSDQPATSTRWRWSVSTLLLAVATVSFWLGAVQSYRSNRQLLREIALMSRMSMKNELRIKDPTRYAVAWQIDKWMSEKACQIYLPEPGTYSVKLATRDIGFEWQYENVFIRKPPKSMLEASIPAGRHCLEFHQHELGGDQYLLQVLVDGRVLLETMEDKGLTRWGHGIQWDSGSVEEPLILLWGCHRDFRTSGRGVVYWIERDKSP